MVMAQSFWPRQRPCRQRSIVKQMLVSAEVKRSGALPRLVFASVILNTERQQFLRGKDSLIRQMKDTERDVLSYNSLLHCIKIW